MTFAKTLLAWYDQNKRELPWRKTRDPYLIWISEIILQQTRVEQGLNYYLRFTERFPTLESLARADEQEVLKTWQGLGYYARARNLHAAAKDLVTDHKGKFPDSYERLVRLRGIGPYTAAAIASMAFGLPCPVVDGNVMRFFSRYFGITEPLDSSKGKKKIYDQALLLIDHGQPGTFNQAIMEFGALQCTPGKPGCDICPLKKSCRAFLDGMVEKLPLKGKPAKQRTRYFHYLVIIKEDREKKKYVYMRKREEQDVWKNLYDFPLVEGDHEMAEEELSDSIVFKDMRSTKNFKLIRKSHLYRHILTHQLIFARFFIFRQTGNSKAKLPYLPVATDEINRYPVSRLVEQFLNAGMLGF